MPQHSKSSSNLALPVSALLATSLLLLPGGATLHAEGEQTVIKIATMAPRTATIALQAKRTNQRLGDSTQGRIQFRTYYGGSAGDDATVMRKLRTGQLDAAPLGVEIVTQFVHQSTVLIAPQTFTNYKQVDAVREELAPEFDAEAYKNGFKVLRWWDAGRARIFSKRPIRKFADLRTGRPWLYPASTLLKEFYRMIDVTGIPLELPEVYGGLQTNMIDTVWTSPVLGAAFRWSSQTEYMSSTAVSVIQGAFIMRRASWDALSPEDQKAITDVVDATGADTQKQFREDDERTYKRLQERGVKPIAFDKPAEWDDAGRKLRAKLVGRSYTRELVDRVEAITKRFPEAS
jgi:TRAP-type C4-dicarboxylate transport system substrate-binding protein